MGQHTTRTVSHKKMPIRNDDNVWRQRRAEEPIIVSGFEGGAPGLWFSLTFIVLGLLSLFGASSSEMWKPVEGGYGPTGMGTLFFGGVLLFLGGWFLKTRWQIEELTPLPLLCKMLGKQEAEIHQIAAERGVRPRYVVNGLEYYMASDLVDAATLLRASRAPEIEPEILLRPASLGAIHKDTLLRIPDEEASASVFGKFAQEETVLITNTYTAASSKREDIEQRI